MHATALLGTAGITAEQALPELFLTADTIGAMMTAGEDRPGAALDAGEHPGDHVLGGAPRWSWTWPRRARSWGTGGGRWRTVAGS